MKPGGYILVYLGTLNALMPHQEINKLLWEIKMCVGVISFVH